MKKRKKEKNKQKHYLENHRHLYRLQYFDLCVHSSELAIPQNPMCEEDKPFSLSLLFANHNIDFRQ